MPREIRIALLDMNDNQPNLGMKNLVDLTERFIADSDREMSYKLFDVRFKSEIPNIHDFDIFLSSGGPGNPHFSGADWENKFTGFLDAIWKYNLENEAKKHTFLICHSFQMAVIHWQIAEVVERESYSFGVMPIYKTKEGKREQLFKNLCQPFYAVDSRSFQCVKPKQRRMKRLGMEVLAIERIRPNRNLTRAVMAIRFSNEIIGTQFHPEADSDDVMCNLVDENYKNTLIEKIGLENYLETLELADDEDKIIKTQAEIIPNFLQNALDKID